MTELLMLWLGQTCPLSCLNVELFEAQLRDSGVKTQANLQHTHTQAGTPAHTKSSSHVQSYFNCFVSVVPSEWERSWRLQFTRHICRCCILNWETQAVRTEHTNRHTDREIYRQIVSSSLTYTHGRCSTVQRFALWHRAWKHWHM